MDSFPNRTDRSRSFRLSEAARILEAEEPHDDDDPELSGIQPLRDAGPADLSILTDRRYLRALEGSRAGAVLVSESVAAHLPEEETRPRLVVPDAHAGLRRLLGWLHPEREWKPEIHPTAVIGAGASLGRGIRIGPYAVLESGVEVGDGVRIGAHCVIGSGSRIGENSLLHPHVVLYPGTVVGRAVILHAGVRLGVDGFGYIFEDGEHRKIPHPGSCKIADEVEIGANCALDRGSIGATRIGRGTKLDNLVQVGHNVTIGERALIAGQVGFAGSARVGDGVVFGGQAGVAGHLEIGDRARLAAQTGVVSDVPSGETYMGFPARPRGEFLRAAAAQRRVPELLRRVRALEERLSREGEERERGEESGGGE